MKNKAIPQHKPIFDKSDADAVYKIIKSGWVSEGSETKKFEEHVRKFVGTKYAIATTSGTAAIFLSLAGCNVKANDEVIVPNVTFVATAMAVKLAGAKPILAEVNKDNFTISIPDIQKKITKKTKAIIPVHLNGRSTELDELKEISKKHNLSIIEDASQALGSKYKNKSLGSIGDVAAFSLAPTKIITTGQGGIITTDKHEVFKRIRKLKDQGRDDKSDHHSIIGYNFKFTDIQAALGNSQFSKLKSRLSIMRKIHNEYYELLKNNKAITIPPKRKEEQLWYFDILTKNRSKLMKYLLKSQINTRAFLKPVNSHEPFRTKTVFPVSKQVCSLGMYLPSYSEMTYDDVENICKKINFFYE